MKRIVFILLLAGIGFYTTQAQSKVYATGGLEMIFSFAQTDNNGTTGGNIMRWAPVFNVQVFGNADFGKHFGLIFGGAIRNVGFIYQVPDTNINLKKSTGITIWLSPSDSKSGICTNSCFLGVTKLNSLLATKKRRSLITKNRTIKSPSGLPHAYLPFITPPLLVCSSPTALP